MTDFAADKADIRKWFAIGADRGHKTMLIVYDRMNYPDNSDSPYYYDDAGSVYEALSAFRHNPMCEVMEIYDLTADMKAQLDEHRAWCLPDLPEGDEGEVLPWRYPASGLLTSGETRLRFMERKNAEFISKKYAEEFRELGAVANPLLVFTDESREFVYDICVYILEQTPVTKATAAAVYVFKPDGAASAHSTSLALTDEEIERGDILIPLPQHHTVEIDDQYITFDLYYAQGKNEYNCHRPAYEHWSHTQTAILYEDREDLGRESGASGVYEDKESHKLYERALALLKNGGMFVEVMDLLYKAANEGHGGAMFELGNCYSAAGDSGTSLNPEKAAHWYKMAALLGHEAAKEKVEI